MNEVKGSARGQSSGKEGGWAEMLQRGEDAAHEAIAADLAARDARDAARTAAPLRQAADALLLDTSALSPAEAIAAAIMLVDGKIAAQGTAR